MRFGRLVGAGQAGFVLQNMDNPKHFYKIVALPTLPLSQYAVGSYERSLYSVNLLQAQLFEQLAKQGDTPPSLPQVYSFTQSFVDPALRRELITSSENFGWQDEIYELLRDLRTGKPYAIWEMEAIPCTDANDYCERYDQDVKPLENQDYQQLLRYLLARGFVVRDVRNPENFGFRSDGSQVFFDPVVAPWPVDTNDPDELAAFVGTFGNDLLTVSRALETGDYFNWYHGQAIMQAEDSESHSITSVNDMLAVLESNGIWIDEDDASYLISLNTSHPDLIKYPAYTMALNYYQRPTDLDSYVAAATPIFKEIWKNYADHWNEYFSEKYYHYKPPKMQFGDTRQTSILDLIPKALKTATDTWNPMTQTILTIINNPQAFQELISEEEGEYIVELMAKEQRLCRRLFKLLDYNPALVSDVCFNILRRYENQYASSRNPQRYFNPPSSVYDYEAFYDAYTNEDARREAYETDALYDFEIRWELYS